MVYGLKEQENRESNSIFRGSCIRQPALNNKQKLRLTPAPFFEQPEAKSRLSKNVSPGAQSMRPGAQQFLVSVV